MKILILSSQCWDDKNSFGSTYSNLFGGNDDYQIANVYCREGVPNTNVCNRFFKITEKSILKSLYTNHSSGQEVYNTSNNISESNSGSFELITNFLKNNKFQISLWIRDLIWATGRWKSKELETFIKDFNPDLIFIPIYYSIHLNQIGLYIKKLTNKPIIGLISDDCYTLKVFSLSPLFWIDRFIKRIYVKKGIESRSFIYTMTEKLKNEYEKLFKVEFKIIYKGGNFNERKDSNIEFNRPLKLLYTGNLNCGRWKTLALIANELKNLNHKAELYIYTQTYLKKSQIKKLTKNGLVFLMGVKPSNEIKQIQSDSDILIHVESFSIFHRYTARLSFSTKIVDYLESSRCILAIGWKNTGAIEYLEKNNGAFIITNPKLIKEKLHQLLTDKSLIIKYSQLAHDLGKKNHEINIIRNIIYSDLKKAIENENNNNCGS